MLSRHAVASHSNPGTSTSGIFTSALIARSLVLLRDHGLNAAALGVDLANPNQALALYESCGFRVRSSSTAYRKPLPAGAPA